MRLLYLLLLFATWLSIGVAEDVGLSWAIEHLPGCAQSCLATAIEHSPCQLTDTTCACTNAELQSTIEACLFESCTVRQSLTTKNVTDTLCNAPVRSAGQGTRITNIVLVIFTTASVVSRFVYKIFFSDGELGGDDYSLMAAFVTGLPSVVVIDKGIVPNGLGLDIWTVPFDHITAFLRYLYVLGFLYSVEVALIKLTLLFFFLRIFPKPRTRRLIWATIIFNGIWTLAFNIIGIFSCQPINYYWTSWDREHKGTCLNLNALAWSHAIISIVLDIWMLALPLHEVFQLQLNWRKKISVSLMFFVGTFVTVVSGLRLKSLVHFAAGANPTWDQTPVIKWSTIEINVGIVCACLPTLRVIFVHMFPAILGSKSEASPSKYKYGTDGDASAGRSVLGRTSRKGSGNEPFEITYSKEFTVQHGESDEMALVQVKKFGAQAPRVRGGSGSVMSV